MTNLDNILQSAFKAEKSADLKPGFDKRVLLALNKKKKRAQRLFVFAIAVGALVILGAIAQLAMIFQPQLAAAGGYFPGVIGLALLLLALQILDKRLVKDRMIGLAKDSIRK